MIYKKSAIPTAMAQAQIAKKPFENYGTGPYAKSRWGV